MQDRWVSITQSYLNELYEEIAKQASIRWTRPHSNRTLGGAVEGHGFIRDSGPLPAEALNALSYINTVSNAAQQKDEALEVALEMIDLERNGTSLGAEFPESRQKIVDALDRSVCE